MFAIKNIRGIRSVSYSFNFGNIVDKHDKNAPLFTSVFHFGLIS